MKPLFTSLSRLSLFVAVLSSTTMYAQWGGGTVRDGEKDKSGERIMARNRYLYEKHAGGPGRRLAPDAYENAAREKVRSAQSQSRTSQLMASAWTSVNPLGMLYARTGTNHISGRTNSMAFHPTDANTFYLAAAGGGVWKTTNGGTNWAVLTDGLPSIMSGAIAIDPGNASVLYYGTGELNYSLDSYYGDGVYKTTNGGSSWSKIVGVATVGSYVSQIVVHPTSSSLVYLSGSAGVLKSTDGGTTWASTSSGANANCVIADPTDSQILYTTLDGVLVSFGVVRKSTNGGASWSTLGGGLPTSDVGRVQLAMAPSDHNTLYASIANATSGTGLIGLYRTTDGGASWILQASSPNYLSGQGFYNNAVCVKPTDANTVIAGGLDNYRSTTGGSGLTKLTAWDTFTASIFTHADTHFLMYNGTVLYCGSDGGVFKSTNDGTSWSDMNATISTLQYVSADYDPTNSSLLYGGCQDNDKQTSTDGGTTWIQRTTGDGGYTVVDPVLTTTVYSQYVQGSCLRSTNSGVSFTEIRPNGGSGGLFYNPFEMAPGDPQTLVYGVSQVWKTTTARTATGASWTQIASTATVGATAGVSAIGISSTNTSKMYVGTDNGRILVTTDNGTNWTTTTGYPYVSDLAVDPSNDDICYATFTGFSASQHVYRTANGGTSWSSVTSNLPNIPCNTIVVVPQTPRWMFVGTDLGVYQSTNEGASWTSANTGMPTLTVYDLKYKSGPKILMAATHGRGCFMNDVSSALPVQLISFTAHALGGGNVDLQWRTISETNNYGFELQRQSSGQTDFAPWANSFIVGHGTTLEAHDYSFIDSSAGVGVRSYRLKQIDLDGTPHFTESVRLDILASVAGSTPYHYGLDQNFPNPFNPSTTIRYGLPEKSAVSLIVFNALGQQVALLQNGEQEAGYHEVTFDGSGLSSGVYFYRIQAGDLVETRRLLLLR
jgi:photosystem II stability/assembly factor-like uncharacterized protein